MHNNLTEFSLEFTFDFKNCQHSSSAIYRPDDTATHIVLLLISADADLDSK